MDLQLVLIIRQSGGCVYGWIVPFLFFCIGRHLKWFVHFFLLIFDIFLKLRRHWRLHCFRFGNNGDDLMLFS